MSLIFVKYQDTFFHPDTHSFPLVCKLKNQVITTPGFPSSGIYCGLLQQIGLSAQTTVLVVGGLALLLALCLFLCTMKISSS